VSPIRDFFGGNAPNVSPATWLEMGDGDDQLAFMGFAQRGCAFGRMRFVERAD
jgi:hypothetical protein